MRHEVLYSSITGIGGAISSGLLVKKLWLEKYKKQKRELETINAERSTLYALLQLKQNHVRLNEYFIEKDFKTISVFDMGNIGRYILDELGDEKEVIPLCGVEVGSFASVHEALTVYRLGEDKLPVSDCLLICCSVRETETLVKARQEFSGQIIMLDEVLNWLRDKHGIRY